MADETQIDIWSGFDHKNPEPDLAPKWCNETDNRRINAYARGKAYVEGVGRHFLNEDPDDPDKVDEWQEFGDIAVLTDQTAGMIVGDSVTYRVVGADDPVSDAPDLPERPDNPEDDEDQDDADPLERAVQTRIFEQRFQRYLEELEAAVDEWETVAAVRPHLVRRQRLIRDWATTVKLTALLIENEIDNIVPKGDGLVELGWSAPDRRCNIEIVRPEAYFPELDPSVVQQFPDVVRLAYPYTDRDGEDWVRRVTYRLVPIAGTSADLGKGDAIPAPGQRPTYLTEGAEWTHACLKTDETFAAADFKDVYSDTENGSSVAATVNVPNGAPVPVDNLYIDLDFVPVVHIPNTLSRGSHFGRSTIARIAQAADELAAADGDESLASRWAGQPPVGVSGMEPGKEEIDLTPGKGIRLGADGSVSTIDMAKNLEQVGQKVLRTLKRIANNASIPEGMLGRSGPEQVASGKLLSLSFVSADQMVKRSRLAREKIDLILKFQQRISIQNGAEGYDDQVVYDAEIVFGPYMPADLAELAAVIQVLVAANMISQETGLKMLQDAGVPSERVDAELAAIRRVMVQHADLLTSALENPAIAAEFLGYDDYEVPDGIDPAGDAVVVPPAAVAQ